MKTVLLWMLLLLAVLLTGCGTMLVEESETIRIGSAVVGMFT